MEDFYNRNFETEEIPMSEKPYEERVWNVFFDKYYELAYVFLAKFHNIPNCKKSPNTPNVASQKSIASSKYQQDKIHSRSDLFQF